VARITFERADEMNALSLAMIDELSQALAIAGQQRAARRHPDR
jgi:enoyl-CoA hydratase/carnithine racemase